MRRYKTLLAVISAVGLMAAVPAIATAADGEFTYRYYDEDEQLRIGTLVDPPSGECVDIPEVIVFYDTYAFRPRNNTGGSATVFQAGDCAGDAFYTLRPGGRASDRLLLRSVVFS